MSSKGKGLVQAYTDLAKKTDRRERDFYPTPVEGTAALLNALHNLNVSFFDKTIWEPACGEGHMSKEMMGKFHKVISSDIYDLGYEGQDGLVDFTRVTRGQFEERFNADWIITNPPFDIADKFINKCIDLDTNFAMLLPNGYFHAQKREYLYYRRLPSYVLPLTFRLKFLPEKGKSPMMNCMWVVWIKGNNNATYLPIGRAE